ncbi:hypothetical protein [Niallia sp. FSL K6-0077]
MRRLSAKVKDISAKMRRLSAKVKGISAKTGSISAKVKGISAKWGEKIYFEDSFTELSLFILK